MPDYGIIHEGRIFTPNCSDVSTQENADRNKTIEQSELDRWTGKPDFFVAYIVQDHNPDSPHFTIATTWPGTQIGYVSYSETRTNNFGHRERYVRVEGTNGARYWGRYGSDWSQACRLRKYKV